MKHSVHANISLFQINERKVQRVAEDARRAFKTFLETRTETSDLVDLVEKRKQAVHAQEAAEQALKELKGQSVRKASFGGICLR